MTGDIQASQVTRVQNTSAALGRAGKTLQGIALLWTLLQGGHALLGGAPLARRVIICCPTSLVNNWDSECVKWLKVRGEGPLRALRLVICSPAMPIPPCSRPPGNAALQSVI